MSKIKKIIKLATASLFVVAALAIGTNALVAPTDVGALTISDGIESAKGDDVATDLTGSGGVFTTIVNILLFVIGAVSVIMLIIGGIRYTVSNGDQNAITGAKNTILYAVIGLVVAFIAYAAVNWVLDSLLS